MGRYNPANRLTAPPSITPVFVIERASTRIMKLNKNKDMNQMVEDILTENPALGEFLKPKIKKVGGKLDRPRKISFRGEDAQARR